MTAAAEATVRTQGTAQERVMRVLRAVRPEHVCLAAMIWLYTAVIGGLSVSVLDGFGQPAFDLGIPDQGIWLLSRFHDPFVTVMGRNLFADHSTWIYLLLVPVYWVYPHTAALLVFQALVIASAAVPIYLLGRMVLGSGGLAVACAGAFLLNPALQQGNLEQFHVECFEVPLLATAVYAAVAWKPRVLLVAVGLLLLCKEDAAMYAIPLAAWVAWRRDRRTGVVIAALSVAVALLDNLVAIPLLLGAANIHGNRLPFGGSLADSVREIVRHPAQVWSYLVSDSRPRYVWQLAFAAGLVFVLAPSIAAIAVVGVALNLWSTFGYQHQIEYHYTLPIVPLLACGTVWGLGRLRSRWRPVATSGVVLVALWSCVLWGLAPFSDESYPHLSPSSPEVAATARIIREVPPGAVVSAWYDYVPELDHRTGIYMWPNPFQASYWGDLKEEGKPLPYASSVRYVVLPVSLLGTDTVWPRVQSQFRLVDEDSEAALFERR